MSRQAAEQLAGLARLVEQKRPTERQVALVLTDLLRTGQRLSSFLPRSAEDGLPAFIRRDFVGWCEGVRCLLHGLVAIEREWKAIPSTELTLEFTLAPGGYGKSLMMVDGSVADVLYFRVLELCQAVGPDVVRKCDCGKVFIKTGRRKYCSMRCQKRVYMREQRAMERRERKELYGKATRTR